MPTRIQNQTVLLGRILLGILYVVSGIGKIFGFAATAAYIASKGLPMPQLTAALSILIEVGGGLLLVLGLFSRQAALGLAAFTMLAAVIFHAFWLAAPAQFISQYVNFMKNVAITGGMLVLVAFGPGAFSLDARRGARGDASPIRRRGPDAGR